MSQVSAILDTVTVTAIPSAVTATAIPTPAPVSLIGAPTVVTFSVEIDLANEQVQYSFLVYQTYAAAAGVTGMASVTDTTAWISTPGISTNFPGVSVTDATATSEISGADIVFSVHAGVNYNKTTPAIYSVTVVP